jgi:hypothetical protein
MLKQFYHLVFVPDEQNEPVRCIGDKRIDGGPVVNSGAFEPSTRKPMSIVEDHNLSF